MKKAIVTLISLLSIVTIVSPLVSLADVYSSFGSFIAHQYVYDPAGAFSGAERAVLQNDADYLRKQGVPTVIYAQALDATYDATYANAQELMGQWQVETQPGARNGLVIFLNLTPGDLHHGHLVVYAGQQLVNGRLPVWEITRIYNSIMLPSLQQGHLTTALVSGMSSVSYDIVHGPTGGLLTSTWWTLRGAIKVNGQLPLGFVLAPFLLILSALFGTRRRTFYRGTGYGPYSDFDGGGGDGGDGGGGGGDGGGF